MSNVKPTLIVSNGRHYRLCRQCKTQYHPVRFDACYDCHSRVADLILCERCEKRKHDSQYSMCYECRFGN